MKPRAHRIASLFIALLLALTAAADAHAFLDRAEPKVGAEVATAPTEVKIWFTQAIEPAFSSIQVFAANGNEVDRKNTHVDKDDAHLLIVSMETVPPGTYKVQWKVVSVDTHHTHGDFKFVVKT